LDLHVPGREKRIEGISLGVDDVRKIFLRLKKLVDEDGEREVSRLSKPDELDDNQWSDRKTEIKSAAFQVTVTIAGISGDLLHGDTEGIFTSPNRPLEISSIYMTNTTAFRWWTKTNPQRSFHFTLDCSRPKLLDSENLVSAPTPNQSNIKIEADSEAWIASITEAVFGVLESNKNNHSALHRAFVYDFGLLLLGFPFALYLAWKASTFIEAKLEPLSQVLSTCAYIYIGLLAIWLYRILFGYTKWVFPTVELKESTSSTNGHRAFWGAILIALIANFAWELIKL
jgi:hypothetical protein